MSMQDKKSGLKRHNPFYQAQAILSRRDHSEREVRFKMRKKGFSSAEVDEVITWLKEKKFLNDQVFAQKYVDSTIRFKAVGKRWLRFKLQQKGVSSENIESALEGYSAEQEAELRQQAIKRWKEQHAKEADPQALARFLASRGFAPFS